MRTGAWMLGLTWIMLVSTSMAGMEADDSPAIASGKVRLSLQITRLGPEGCLVEIKPAHKGCDFKPISRRLTVDERGRLELDPIEVKTSSAERDCMFAITITEPKQEPKTFRRALRITNTPPDGILTVQTLPCYLSYQSPPAQVAEGNKGEKPKK